MSSTWSSDRAAADHTANVLGALALAVSDRIAEAVSTAATGGVSDATALSALRDFLHRPSIDVLAQVLGLTHSGAVRLVDRLDAAGLTTRESGKDGRTTTISLSSDGQGLAHAVAEARRRALLNALAPLSAEDRHTLDRLLGVVLAGLIREPGARRWICRLCDTAACGRPAGRCPVAAEARTRHPNR